MDKKVRETIQSIAEAHSNKTYSYLEKDDLKSEIWCICIGALQEYEPKHGPLENFLRKTVRNRLVNRFKEITKTVSSPCPKCEFFDTTKPGDCAMFGEEKGKCDKWKKYQINLESRNNLLAVSDYNKTEAQKTSHVDILANKEMLLLIREKLSKEFQYEMDRFLSGEKINQRKMEILVKECKRVAGG